MENKPEPESNNPKDKSSKEDIFRPIEEPKNAAQSGSSASDKSSQETQNQLDKAKQGGFGSSDKALELGQNKAQENISNNKDDKAKSDNQTANSAKTPAVSELYKIPSSPLKGKYEFIQVVGAGGAGVIYKAKQNPLGRIVAIKMVHSHIVSQRSLKRFEQEARTISNLVHPNIISIHDFGVSEDEQPYMVMDYIDGEPLSEYIKRNGRLSIDETVHYASQICDGLSHAHAKGILHRDLKPNNIMLVPLETGDNHIKILDFGLAKLIHEEEDQTEHLTKTGETVGTPAYMSPEQVMGKNMDKRTDVYALGCVMYHCLTGSPPFLGETKMETMLMHLNKAPISVNEFVGEEILDPLFDSLILKLLAKDPKERFSSLQEVKDSIVASQKGLFAGIPQKPEEPIVDSKEQESLGSSESEPALRFLVEFVSKNKITTAILVGILLIGAPLVGFIYNLNKPVKKFSKEEVIKKAETLEPEAMPDQQFYSIIDKMKKDVEHQNATAVRTKGLKISDDALLYLKKIHNLHELYLDGSPVSDKALKHLVPMVGIQSLSLLNTKVSDDGMKTLAEMPNLKVLSLENCNITDKALKSIGQCKELVSLSLANTKITSQNIAELSSLKNLSRLNLDNTKITDQNLGSLAPLSNLTQLSINNTDVSDPGIKEISKIRSLRKLEIAGTKITKSALNYIGKLPYLGTLDLSRTGLTDSCLENLKKISGLDRLKVEQVKISQDTIGQYLTKEPQCKVHKAPE